MAVSLRYIGFSCIVFLALQQVANGLTCYSCIDCSSVSSSTETANLTDSNAACYKTIASALGISAVTRGVVDNCVASSVSGVGNYCCSTDLCNGGLPLSGSLGLALALVAGISILKAIMIN